MLSAENMGNETIVKLMNQTATDKVLSLSNLTASDENHDENTKYTLDVKNTQVVVTE